MKQMWKKITGFFLAFVCTVPLMASPVFAKVQDSVKDSIAQNFESLVYMMNNYSEDEMATQIEPMESEFLNSMVDRYYGIQKDAGSFKEIKNSEVIVNEADKTADVIMDVSFENGNAVISAVCNYDLAATATSFDQLWSGFDMDINYPISVMLKRASTGQKTCFVLAALLIILVLVWYFRKKDSNQINEEASEKKSDKDINNDTIILNETDVSTSDHITNEELTAILSAAVLAYEEEQQTQEGYIARKLKNRNKNWRRF